MNTSAVKPVQYEIRVSPDVAKLHQEFTNSIKPKGNIAPNTVICVSNKEQDKNQESFYKFAFFTGIAAAALQVTSGLAFMSLRLLSGKEKYDSVKLYTGKAKLPAKIAFSTLGLSYLVCAPSTMGAGVNAQQPGIVLHSVVAGGLGVLGMMRNINTRFKGLLSLVYAPLFAGFANKIHNEFGESPDKQTRKMNVDFTTNADFYKNIFAFGENGKDARGKLVDFIKFSLDDMKNGLITSGESLVKTFKQTKNYITGKREDLPDLISMKPTKESMSLAATLAIIGSVPKVIFGEKLGMKGKWAKAGFVADLIIGAGFLFDSIGMMSIANANNDDRKLPMMVGGPMRMIGDFRQESNLFYGLRTMGGAAFEYYYALMNKEKDGKLQ